MLILLWGLAACGPELPSSFRIAAEPAGKLRLLGIAAEPPEARPGEEVRLAALVVTHPRSGERQVWDGREVGTPTPRGLSHLWLLCRAAPGQAAPEACGLGAPGATLEVRPLGSAATAGFAAPDLTDGDLSLVVTLVVADEAQAGGAMGCYEAAQASGGAVADPAHCVVGIKRVKVSRAARPNRNPGIAGLGLVLPGGEEPSVLFVDRAADAIEREPDPDQEGAERDEVVVVTYFVTAGTLAAGRGGYQAPGCAELPECPPLLRSQVGWTPPDGEAALGEAPDGLVFFFGVLRDDRGGLSYEQGRAVFSP